MRIAILHPSYEGSSSPCAGLDPEVDPGRFLPEASFESFRLTRLNAVRIVTEVARAGFDVVINLCDGAWEEDRPGIEVVEALERLDVAFTGAGSHFYDPSREAMKMACAAEGVAFPAYAIVRSTAEVSAVVDGMRLPMIVKPLNGYSSIGLTPASRVETMSGLLQQVEATVERFGAALIEEFVTGREFTVLVTEPRERGGEPWVLAPVEFVFPPGESWKHFDLKWRDHESMSVRGVDDPALDAALRNAAARVFAGLEGSGFGRCDIRVDARGQPILLEINPNCGMFYPDNAFGSADFIVAREPGGHRAFLEHLIARAIERRDRARRAWALRYTKSGGFGMVAARPIRIGEIAVRYEETSVRLISAEYGATRWRADARSVLDAYAWPISPSVYAMWSEDPAEWRPINHSCDPSAWLVGLDLAARRDLPAGAPITVDYATFSGPEMPEFTCACGAPNCRGMVRGSDGTRDDLRAKYGNHVSDYVRTLDVQQFMGPASVLERAGRFVLGKSPTGHGLFAVRAFDEGEVVSNFRCSRPHAKPSRWTLQCGESEHADLLPAELSFLTHSCDPNVEFSFETMTIRARRTIGRGEELSFFYPATEWEMSSPFSCVCGSVACVGVVKGAATLPRETLERYRLSPFVRARLAAVGRPGGA